MIARRSHAPRGFTLVELLVVIGIIGVLAALITTAASGVVTKARATAVKVEIDGIAGALQQYKSEHGSYPPNFNDQAAVERHLRKRFPRIAPGEVNNIRTMNLTPAQALVFWLSALSNDNPRAPYTGGASGEKLYNFDPDRVVGPNNVAVDVDQFRSGGSPYNGNLFPVYLPPHGDRALAVEQDAAGTMLDVSGTAFELRPILYFSAEQYGSTAYQVSAGGLEKGPYRRGVMEDDGSGNIVAVPADEAPFFVNPDSFQVISAGIDGMWGNVATDPNAQAAYPVGANYWRGDRDNLVNFDRKNLWDAIP